MNDVGLYVHFPFCRSRCAYCDFATFAGLEALQPRYADALVREIALLPDGLKTRSVYLGGGTPSLFAPDAIARVVSATADQTTLAPDAEITMEANPGDLTPRSLERLRAAGVNRLSIGVQSFDDATLRAIGRRHDATRAIEAVAEARAAGFDNVSIDLIFGLPGQTVKAWRDELAVVRDLAPQHLSLYCLTLDDETPLGAAVAAGRVSVPDDDATSEMYEVARAALGADYRHYEISNWARKSPLRDLRSFHNLLYWTNSPYIGVGAAAHSSFSGRRYHNVVDPRTYLSLIEAGEPTIDGTEIEVTTPESDLADTLMLGLRLIDGIDIDALNRRHEFDVLRRYERTIADLTEVGLIEVIEGRLKLTTRGLLLGNEVFQRFLV